MSKWMNRKDVAALLECSVAQVRKGEKRLGLSGPGVKQVFNSRCVRYHRAKAEAALRTGGYI